jgi:hypothetical protein
LWLGTLSHSAISIEEKIAEHRQKLQKLPSGSWTMYLEMGLEESS